MGGKNRFKGGRDAAKAAAKKKLTVAKVKNKQKNQAKRSKYKGEREARKNAASRESNPVLSAEHGFVVRSNPRAAKKAERRRLAKAERERKRLAEEERNAPVRPEDLERVFMGAAKAKDLMAARMSELERKKQEAKELKKKGMKVGTGKGGLVVSMQDDDDIDDEEQAKIYRKIRGGGGGDDDEVDSDDEEDSWGDEDDEEDDLDDDLEEEDGEEGDEEDEDEELEMEEEEDGDEDDDDSDDSDQEDENEAGISLKEKRRREEENRKKQEAKREAKRKAREEKMKAMQQANGGAMVKAPIIPPKMAAALKSKGVEVNKLINEKLQAKEAKKQAHRELLMERQRQRELKWAKDAGMEDGEEDVYGERLDSDPSSDDDLTNDPNKLARYTQFFSKFDESLANAPLLEKVKQQRHEEILKKKTNNQSSRDEEEEDKDEEEEEEEEEGGSDEDGDDNTTIVTLGKRKRESSTSDNVNTTTTTTKGSSAGSSSQPQAQIVKKTLPVRTADGRWVLPTVAVAPSPSTGTGDATSGKTSEETSSKKRKLDDGSAQSSESSANKGKGKGKGKEEVDMLEKYRRKPKGGDKEETKGEDDGEDGEAISMGDMRDALDEARVMREENERKLKEYKASSGQVIGGKAGELLAMIDSRGESKFITSENRKAMKVIRGELLKKRRKEKREKAKEAAALERRRIMRERERDSDDEDNEEDEDGEDEDEDEDEEEDDNMSGEEGGDEDDEKSTSKRRRIPTEPTLSVEQQIRARKLRIERVKIAVAELCEDLMATPDKFVPSGHLAALLDLCRDADSIVRQICFVSATQIFVDLIPLYRIRLPSNEELEKERALGRQVSRDVQQQRNYDRAFLTSYTRFIAMLRKNVGAVVKRAQGDASHATQRDDSYKGVPLISLQCLCRIFERAYAFNLSKEIATFLAGILTSRFEVFRNLVAKTVVEVFKIDTSGDASLEIVRAIAHVFKNKGGDRVRSQLLEVLLALPLSKEILTSKDLKRKVGGGTEIAKTLGAKWKKIGGRGNHALTALKEAQRLKELEEKGKLPDGQTATANGLPSTWTKVAKDVDKKQLKQDLAEGDADVALEHKKKTQTAILSTVFTIYFRYLKQAPSLKTLFKPQTADDLTVRVGLNYTSASGKGGVSTHGNPSTENTDSKDAKGNDSKNTNNDSSTTQPATIRGQAVALGPRTGVPPLPPSPPSEVILHTVLKGISQYAHLINLELLLDLLEHIKLVIGASAMGLTMSPSAEHSVEKAAKTLVDNQLNAAAKAKAANSHTTPTHGQKGKAGMNGNSDDQKQQQQGKKKGKGRNGVDEIDHGLSAAKVKEIQKMAEYKVMMMSADGTHQSFGLLPLRSALLCVHTAFTLLKMYNNAIVIDLTAFYRHFYELTWQLVLPANLPHLPLALECFELLLLSQRAVPPPRVAALCRRMLLVGIHLKPNNGLAVAHAVGRALNRHPRALVILENEAYNSGQYDPLSQDPDLSQALSSPAWDTVLWPFSYHPFASRLTAHALSLPQMPLEPAQRGGSSAAIAHAAQAAAIAAKAASFGSATSDKEAEKAAVEIANQRAAMSIPVAGERVMLVRLDSMQMMRILDATRGAFVPDIQKPTQSITAIADAEMLGKKNVPNSVLKQALGRAKNVRSTELLTSSLNPIDLLPDGVKEQVLEEAGIEISMDDTPSSGGGGGSGGSGSGKKGGRGGISLETMRPDEAKTMRVHLAKQFGNTPLERWRNVMPVESYASALERAQLEKAKRLAEDTKLLYKIYKAKENGDVVAVDDEDVSNDDDLLNEDDEEDYFMGDEDEDDETMSMMRYGEGEEDEDMDIMLGDEDEDHELDFGDEDDEEDVLMFEEDEDDD